MVRLWYNADGSESAATSELRSLVTSGLSSSRIAETLSRKYAANVSKDAVIGKCRNLSILLKNRPGGVRNKTGNQHCTWGPARRERG